MYMCESYIIEKQKKFNFMKGDKDLRLRKMELVHKGLWGQSLVASCRGFWYYITLINDFNRKVRLLEK